MTSKVQPKLQITEPLTVKTWGRGWVVLVVRKWLTQSAKHCQNHSKKKKKTTRLTTSAIWSIFTEQNRLLSPQFLDKDALSIKTLHRPREGSFSLFLDLELFSEGVIHLGLRPRWITPSSIYRILHILRKPNSIIANYYFKHGENVKCVSHIRISLCFAFMIHPRILFASARASA